MAAGPPYSPYPSPHDPSASPYDSAVTEQPLGEYPWLAPATLPPGMGPSSDGRGRAPLYDLRPLSTGEVLDRTFSLYRSRFLLFAGIASLSAVVRLIGQGVQLSLQSTLLRHGGVAALSITSNLLSLAMSAVFLLAFAVTQAATVWAVGEVYLRGSASVSGSVRATVQRWLRFVGIAMWQIGSAAWPAVAVSAVFGGIWFLNGRSLGLAGAAGLTALLVLLLIGAFVVGTIFYLRNLLAVPAAVREGLGVRAAMRRSKVLSQGAKGKLFLILLIAAALYFVMGILLATVLFIAVLAHHGNGMGGNFLAVQILTLVVLFVGYTLISPVILVGTTLVYFDQRVRLEAFDLAVLLGDESALGTLAPEGEAAAAFAGAAPVVEPPGGAAGL